MPTNLQIFMERYAAALRQAVLDHPDQYRYPVESVPSVVEKMKQAIIAKTYSKDGHAFKAVCKQLGIKYTYTAINEYVAG